VSAVDERDDVAACCCDAADGCDLRLLLHAVWLRVDDECCGCWLLDGVVTGLPGLLLCVVLAEGGAVSHACCCRDGETPIHKAARVGHLSILEFLVARGADVHAQDK
jgi:ankyrin repeat protein